ncbi:hypothetical protein Barb4_04141 [Bacteroidales bacterium Barb4]|nr:hypothetical protein Barb4_04141 [Bacteroidales bacterium Barb4]
MMIYKHIIFQSFFQNSLDGVILVTPHSASLHVGLKSPVPVGLLRNINHKLTFITYLENKHT